VAINVPTRTSKSEHASLFEQAKEMSFAGVQTRGMLLDIDVSVEPSAGATTALVLDVPLQESCGPL
jgi:hypothetical protein